MAEATAAQLGTLAHSGAGVATDGTGIGARVALGIGAATATDGAGATGAVA
jgi:hypothetical protein